MPKSKNRKNHKQKAASRRRRLECQARQQQKIFEEIRRMGEEQYQKQMQEQMAKENAEQVEGIDDLEIEDEDEDEVDVDIDIDVEENEKTSD